MIKEGVCRSAENASPRRIDPGSRWLALTWPERPGKMDPQDVDVEELIHLLIGVDTPQPLLLDPAIEAVAGNTAPAGRAMLDLGYHPGLQAGCNRAGWIRAIVQRREFVLGFHGDNRSAAARQQRMIDPALGAFGITDPAPVLEFSGDFNRQARTGVDPGDVVVLGRAGPDVDVIGFEADVTRHRQSAGRDGRILCRKTGAHRCPQHGSREHHHRTNTPQRHQLVSCRDTNSNRWSCNTGMPDCRPGSPPYRIPLLPRLAVLGFLFWPGLLLERTERSKTRRPRIFPGNEREISGNPRKPRAGLASKRRDHAAAAVSNNRVNEA